MMLLLHFARTKSENRKANKIKKKHLKFPPESAIMNLQRVAFLRKSGCRNAARFLRKWGKVHKQIVQQKCVSPGLADLGISYSLKER